MDRPAFPAEIEQLTEPQRACLRLVTSHHSSKEIAYLLGVSPSAVDKRIERAVQLLRVSSRFAAARALSAFEGTPATEPEPGEAMQTGEWLPCDPIDLPSTPEHPASGRQEEPWWLVRRLVGLSSPIDRVGGRNRNDLTVLQRLGLIMVVTLFVAVSSMAVLNMAVTLSGILREHRTEAR